MGQETEPSRGPVRGALVLANCLTGVACLVTVAVGIWTLADQSFLTPLVPDRLFLSSAYIQVVGGLLCLANCLFGCYAAFKEVKVLLVVYGAISTLLLTVLVMAGVMVLIFRGQVGSSMKAQLVRDIRRYDPGSPISEVTQAWDSTQSRLQCCGLLTPKAQLPWQSWSDNALLNPGPESGVASLPASCCPHGLPVCSGNDAWPGDCYLLGTEFLRIHSSSMAGVVLATAATTVFGLLFSAMLFRKLA